MTITVPIVRVRPRNSRVYIWYIICKPVIDVFISGFKIVSSIIDEGKIHAIFSIYLNIIVRYTAMSVFIVLRI